MKDKNYYIQKAKHQRGLSDEQIYFFLERHPRWDLLPYYACYVKKMGEQGALEEVISQFGKGKYYRVCKVRCKNCGDILKHTFQSKDAPSCRMLWCSCSKTALDPHPIAYRILGDDFEDLSEEWDE